MLVHAYLICHFNFVFFFGVTYIKFNFLINLHIDEFVIDHRECDKHMARV